MNNRSAACADRLRSSRDDRSAGDATEKGAIMGKPLVGLLLGGVLGIFDGLSALLSAGSDPAVREGIAGIVIGSTFKGLLVGLAAGFFARKCNSMTVGILFGLGVGAVLAFAVALMGDLMEGQKYYLEIMLPGSLLGVIVGFATQKYGKAPGQTAAYGK